MVRRGPRVPGFGFPQLDYLLRHRFNPAAPFVPAESTLAQTLAGASYRAAQGRRGVGRREAALRESAVIDRVSAALGVPADVTGALLERVTHEGESALQRFLELAA